MERKSDGLHFSEETHPVVVSEEEKFVSVRTKDIFDNEIKRATPWMTKDGRILIFKPQREHIEIVSGEDLQKYRAIIQEEIPFEAVSSEEISDTLADVILTFKRIEDKLPDFTGRAAGVFRNYWGINNSYNQWSREESEHSNAEGFTLTATGHLSQEEIVDDYLENLERTWESPFPTPRQMVLYAYFQETLTNRNYVAVAERAEKEGAPTVGRIMRLIAKDEAYHGGGYRKFAQVFAEFDREGTINDACYVALNFRMPAMHLMRDREQNSLAIMRVGAFSKKIVSEETIFRGLRRLDFVPEELCLQVANDYWPHQREVAHLFNS